MKETMKSVLKGMVIGIANIIPGVSGGTMMVAMGIYDKLIHCITHLFSELKKNILFLLPIGIGMVIAIIGGSFGIEYLFNTFPLPTTTLFIGLIVGGFPAIWKKVKGNSIKVEHIIPCLLFFALVVVLAFVGEKEDNAAELTIDIINIFKLFVVGIIAAATMVIPGVSGSMMLMLLGYYNPIIETINAFIRSLVSFDMNGMLHGVGILAPFGIGIVVGIFAIAKLIEIIFEKFPLQAYWAIIGLIIASPIAIIVMGEFATITIMHVLASVVTLAAGFIVAMKLGE